MEIFENYTNDDFDKIAKDVISLSNKDESELYRVLGHATYDMGIQSSDKKNILFERVDKGKNGISALRAFNFVAKTEPLSDDEAEKRGKKFWRIFSEKIRKAICNNPTIIEIINGKATLKEKLAAAIPAILAVIGGGIVLGPVYITLISIALAIIIKTGLEAYCEIE